MHVVDVHWVQGMFILNLNQFERLNKYVFFIVLWAICLTESMRFSLKIRNNQIRRSGAPTTMIPDAIFYSREPFDMK